MEYRPLGRTGVQVRPLCLGTMMFGAWGNTDHDDSVRIIHRALDAGINFVDTADVYSRRRVRGDRRQGAQGPPRRRRPGHQVLHADGRRPQPARRLAALDRHARSRTRCAACSTDHIDLYQVHRPDPARDVDETLGALTDLVRQGKVRYIGSSSYSGGADRRGAVDGPRAPAASASAPSSRRTRCSSAASSSTCCPTAQRHGMGILTYSPLAGGWLSGSWTRRQLPHLARAPAPGRPLRHGAAREPAQARGRRAARPGRRGRGRVDDRAGHRASSSTTPAVTSAIIGPRTMEQLESQLPAAGVTLDAATLDRIDEIVTPGVNLNPADTSYGEQVLATRPPPPLRRTPHADHPQQHRHPEGPGRLVHRRRLHRRRSPPPPAAPRSPPRSSTSPPAPGPPGTRTRTARRSSSPRASGAASARAARSRRSARATACSSSPARTTGTAPRPTASWPTSPCSDRRVRQRRQLGRHVTDEEYGAA